MGGIVGLSPDSSPGFFIWDTYRWFASNGDGTLRRGVPIRRDAPFAGVHQIGLSRHRN
ncbi:MAG: hypothetical protein IH956_08670 [Chloroflexi bacterium]|nr:hypothetical protein [Chloroflexota bacterium]